MSNVEAQVHKQYGAGYRVKVLVHDIGLFINGMMIYPPSEDHPDWNVLTPARPAGRGKYARIVEFNKKKELWEQVETACIQAVKDFGVEAADDTGEGIANWSDEKFQDELESAFKD